MTETYEVGVVEKISTWKSGKGYFLKISGVETDFYAFGKCPVNEGDEVKYESEEGTGSFSDREVLTMLKHNKEDRAKPEKKPEQKKQASEPAETYADTPKEYRQKQINVMLECLADADQICGEQSAMKKDVALALFDKRSTHLFWYLQEKQMAKP